jgi:hypothetical protein
MVAEAVVPLAALPEPTGLQQHSNVRGNGPAYLVIGGRSPL